MTKDKSVDSTARAKPIENGIIQTYSTTLDLTPEAHKRNQFIYASQLYGTFFAVYAIFHISKEEDDTSKEKDDTSKEKDDSVKIKIGKIVFNILNYKGPIDLGITSVNYDSKEKMFYLHVKALAQPELQHECDFGKKGLEVAKGEYLHFHRELDKMTPDRGDEDKWRVFDSEFYIRDGVQKIPKIRFDQISGQEIKDLLSIEANKEVLETQGNFDLNEVLVDEIRIHAPGKRCVPSTARVMF